MKCTISTNHKSWKLGKKCYFQIIFTILGPCENSFDFWTYPYWISPWWTYLVKKFWKQKSTIFTNEYGCLFWKKYLARFGWDIVKNRISEVPHFFQVFKNGLICNFIASNMLGIMSPMLRQSHGYPLTLGWVNLKKDFGHAKFFLSMAFLSMPILISGVIYSAPNGLTPK